MGIVSRQVVPICGNLCFCCPSLRARSRQPVKRYKKLLSDIFPRNQEAEANDRKIGKLCEYASKNSLRIPKITDTLEQRFYKELRHEHFGSVKVVVAIYRKLLLSCKKQMPLFAGSLLEIIQTLLDQTQQHELQILACITVVDFINSQMDSTYMFSLEGLIPKLCQLAQDVGDGERNLHLRSAGLQALASMVYFMGEHSHISMNLDHIISATLENFIDFHLKAEHGDSSFPDIGKRFSLKPDLDPSLDTSKSPPYWARVCLCNMARLTRAATTVRRVLERLFHNFDTHNFWSPVKGVAYPVMMNLQLLLEEAGESSRLLLSIVVKHLDHKNVAKQPLMQIDIVNVIMQLVEHAKPQATVAITGAISDLMRHLRKCMQSSSEVSSIEEINGIDKSNADLQFAIEKCILQLANKVGDVGPILDVIAVFLENISNTTIVARATISTAHRTSQIISSIPNISYHKKAFPHSLFHQLLVAMAHPDHETRVGAHCVFSIVLMPSLISPWPDQNKNTSEVVSPSFGTLQSESLSFQDEVKDKGEIMDGESCEEQSQISDIAAKKFGKLDSCGPLSSFKRAIVVGKTITSLRLSSHQIGLLLSSIWVQATSVDNMPENFEAMAHTYNIALLFTRSKTSSHMALVQCFQLAFSLRSISLNQEGALQPSRRRSLFTLASYMLIFSARAGNLPEIIPFVKASLTDRTVDPYFELVDGIRLQAVHVGSDSGKIPYGSEEDDTAASRSLSAIELDDHHLKETLMSHIMKKFTKLSEDELLGIKTQLLDDFLPDDAYTLGAPLFMETSLRGSPIVNIEFEAFEEITPAAALTDDEAMTEPNGSQSDHRTSLSANTVDILSVKELLESVLETAQQVASSQVSSTPVPYDQIKSQCEALVTGKQEKMSILKSFNYQYDSKVFSSTGINKGTSVNGKKVEFSPSDHKLQNNDQTRAPHWHALYILEQGQNSFRLPPSSPYDKFLIAAGC